MTNHPGLIKSRAQEIAMGVARTGENAILDEDSEAVKTEINDEMKAVFMLS